MIKKISLLGLCFNLGVALGRPTQTELETFLKTQSDKFEVTYQKIGELSFPVGIILKNQKDCEVFANQYGEVWFPEQTETAGLSSEETNETPDTVIGATVVAEEGTTPSIEGNTAEEAETLPSEIESADSTSAEDYILPKKLTAEEQRERFNNYSRSATPEELALVKSWGVENLRIVDFDSIVSGLTDETQREKAKHLIQQGNKAELLKAIDWWVDGRGIDKERSLTVFVTENEGPIGRLGYTLNPEVIGRPLKQP